MRLHDTLHCGGSHCKVLRLPKDSPGVGVILCAPRWWMDQQKNTLVESDLRSLERKAVLERPCCAGEEERWREANKWQGREGVNMPCALRSEVTQKDLVGKGPGNAFTSVSASCALYGLWCMSCGLPRCRAGYAW